MKKPSKNHILVASILFNIVLCVNNLMYGKLEIPVHHHHTKYVEIPKELTEWDMFTMALMQVESEYDSLAVSSVGAKGYFQITPIYIKEVNRIHNTNYTMDDVTDFESAYRIFDLMQQAHNKDYDMDKALTLHNGDHDWYKRRVMNAYQRIKKYEEVRTMLVSLE